LIYRQLNISHLELWSVVVYGLFLLFLWTRARALKSRVAELVDVAAHRAGLQRVMRKGKTAAPIVAPEIAVAVNLGDPATRNLPE
jgi:hypothetical protein